MSPFRKQLTAADVAIASTAPNGDDAVLSCLVWFSWSVSVSDDQPRLTVGQFKAGTQEPRLFCPLFHL